ncbi:hypothetical protein [Fibrisoma limi]|nr:hypothetical protein [Fibrisoma limi]
MIPVAIFVRVSTRGQDYAGTGGPALIIYAKQRRSFLLTFSHPIGFIQS